MEKALELALARRPMAYQTAEITEAGQLIYEATVDQESDDGQERRLGDRGAPPVRRGGLDDRVGYPSKGEEGGDDGDDDGGMAEDDLSLTLHESITYGSDQAIPFARRDLVLVNAGRSVGLQNPRQLSWNRP